MPLSFSSRMAATINFSLVASLALLISFSSLAFAHESLTRNTSLSEDDCSCTNNCHIDWFCINTNLLFVIGMSFLRTRTHVSFLRTFSTSNYYICAIYGIIHPNRETIPHLLPCLLKTARTAFCHNCAISSKAHR